MLIYKIYDRLVQATNVLTEFLAKSTESHPDLEKELSSLIRAMDMADDLRPVQITLTNAQLTRVTEACSLSEWEDECFLDARHILHTALEQLHP